MDNKCAHPPCKCLISKDSQYGKYCSEHCREAADVTELRCDCKHPACPVTSVAACQVAGPAGRIWPSVPRPPRASVRPHSCSIRARCVFAFMVATASGSLLK
jgi:hypothetical protein